MSLETPRTFIPLHQQALYNLARLALIILEHAENGNIEDVANCGIKLAVTAQNLLAEIDAYTDTLQAIATPASQHAASADGDLAATISTIQAMMQRGELNYCPIHGNEITLRINGSRGCQECDWQQGYPVHEMYPEAQAVADSLNTATYKQARGITGWQVGDERAEDSIWRVRDGNIASVRYVASKHQGAFPCVYDTLTQTEILSIPSTGKDGIEFIATSEQAETLAAKWNAQAAARALNAGSTGNGG